MNKSELVDAVSVGADLSKAAADRAVNIFMKAVAEALAAGQEVVLPGFGKFEVRERAARSGRNPKTGEVMEIAASKTVAFKPAKAVKDAVAD